MTDAYGAQRGRAGKTVNSRRLGEGGMGEVYQATHIAIGRPVAIKFLHAHLARNDEFVARFQREAQSAGALVDENIVAVTDFGGTAAQAGMDATAELRGTTYGEPGAYRKAHAGFGEGRSETCRENQVRRRASTPKSRQVLSGPFGSFQVFSRRPSPLAH